MARSNYIYLALCGELPVAAFTVKIELFQWLRKQSPGLQDRLLLMRLVDGDPAATMAKMITADELFSSYEKQQGKSESE